MKIALTATLSAAAAALILSACAADMGTGSTASGSANGGGATAIGKNLMGMYVQNQCSTELNKRNEWRLMALAVSADQQQKWEEQICGCVAEEAPNSITVNELMTAAVNPAQRNGIFASAVGKTLTSCIGRVAK